MHIIDLIVNDYSLHVSFKMHETLQGLYQFHFAGVLSKLEILYVLDVRNVEWNTVVIKEHT